jgi:hypothetical protein
VNCSVKERPRAQSSHPTRFPNVAKKRVVVIVEGFLDSRSIHERAFTGRLLALDRCEDVAPFAPFDNRGAKSFGGYFERQPS